jgi:hypothetical protein
MRVLAVIGNGVIAILNTEHSLLSDGTAPVNTEK